MTRRKQRSLQTWSRPHIVRGVGPRPQNYMKPGELLHKELLQHGGAIVLSSNCSELEIADAQATNRFAVDKDGIGYVRRTQEWLDRVKELNEASVQEESVPSKPIEPARVHGVNTHLDPGHIPPSH